ncbi:outer membrane protein OmpA-like peptidoglycan-associated protein/tetratricopeptide (TPR) repeat protein [Lewinella aquimaris]|uniref:Outer membrane protein OmpA-like peptidoglycan-associated protein/tetratricopeptide (TPR) repeat protein n=1 Tax=Neolewinella aquimaris TaxID=1835722 RepID=A0A840EIJ5_9BACT|nr:OmpA family protein [Neolewinella aquimaris]MBB4080716.1 outer membrane protein OmpA-like peptidoglycan-associated protein/tetratricopeptide (TPR) repeat protein [Neolewinella aquimaris]
MRIVLLIVLPLLLFASSAVFGQESSRNRAIAAFDAGVQHLLDGNAKRASKSLRQAVALDSTFVPGLRMLGIAYDLQNDYANALKAYLAVINHDPYFSRVLYYHTGDVYLRDGQPRRALEYLQKFRELQAEDIGRFGLVGEQETATEQEILNHKLEQRILSARILTDSINYTNATGLYNLGAPINTEQNDYFPFFTNDLDGLLFTRQGKDGDEDLIEGARRRPERNYRTSRFGNFNTNQPEGMCTLVRDGETIFFTLCHEDAGGGGCDIYSGILIKGRIEEVTRLPDYVNSTTWDSQAAISCDGRQLFFASTRPGGIGGSDLYRSERLDDGSWSEPRNLGAGVNTPEDEEAPFLSNDGETLYFSSMGHRGLGDQDIYFSRWDAGRERWSKAINIGPPINSANRELGFHLSADGRQGFFASDRPGGRGGLDIYGFTLDEKLTGKEVTYVAGYLTDSLSGKPIADQEVPVSGGAVFRTNYAGRFFICAPPNQQLPLSVDHPDYLPYRRDFAIPAWDNQSPYRVDLRLTKEALELPAIPPPPPPPPAKIRQETARVLFAFGEDAVNEGQYELLKQLVAGTGTQRIESVSIVGYADEVGQEVYNLELSRRRALAVARVLEQLGVSEDRITTAGRGEIAGRAGRNLNRRVEVIVRFR